MKTQFGCRFLLPLAIACIAGASTLSAQTTPELIFSINEFSGSINDPRNLADESGVISRIPEPGGTAPSTDRARDLIYGADNAIYLYNGTLDAHLARYDMTSGTWNQVTMSGWNTGNNVTYGGLTAVGQYIYATDMQTGGAANPGGIIRFDTGGGAPIRFADTLDPSDINAGFDGLLYILDGAASLTDEVLTYDPFIFAPADTITVPRSDYRGVAAAADGTIYLADWNGTVSRFSDTGTLIDSLTVPSARFSDINIAPNGQIALGTGFSGEVVLTDLDLDSFSRFRVTDSTIGGDVFVAWKTQPVPEPSTWALLSVGALGLMYVRSRKRS